MHTIYSEEKTNAINCTVSSLLAGLFTPSVNIIHSVLKL